MTFQYATLDRGRLRGLIARERASFSGRNPRSSAQFNHCKAVLIDGVPMTWMRMWAGGFPLVLREAHDARLTDIDGHEYIDFCLGDSGAMAGHAP